MLLCFSVVCYGLPIKQICSNALFWSLALTLQMSHLDQLYAINIQSEFIALVSFLLIIVLYLKFHTRSAVSFQTLQQLSHPQQINYLTLYGAMHVKFNPRSHFLTNYQFYNMLKKLLFIGLLVFNYSHAAGTVAYIIIQQLLWVIMLSTNRINKQLTVNLTYIFGEIQLMLTSVLMLLIEQINQKE